MINVLIVIGAMLIGLRMIGPFLRIAISLIAKSFGAAFITALMILLFVLVLSHGRFI